MPDLIDRFSNVFRTIKRDNNFKIFRWVSKARKYRLAIEALQKFLELAPKGDGDIKPVKREIRVLKKALRKSRKG